MVKAYFDNIRQQILNELDKATNKIVVAVYWFTNEALFQKLVDKLSEGVRVELIIHNDYINNRDAGLPFQDFIKKGGDFYFSSDSNPMHNKFCVIDNNVLINGSYNWTYYAEDRNRENIILIKDEKETIEAFLDEFERLKSPDKIQNIRTLTMFEVDEFNQLRARDYLANDIVFKAKESGIMEILDIAFKIAPNNIEVQKTAFELQLTKRIKLKYSIGSSLQGDTYLIIIPKGTFLPVSQTKLVKTVADNQVNASATILYGESPKASHNVKLGEMKISGLPPKPAGEALVKFHFTIDIYGNLRIKKYSLDTGKKDILNKSITELLEEVKE